ncbi:MAG: hypothetical protein IH588_00925 [Anaerolineales bacterium]|nr:hypothetical protein [Anaerolineales bacterium]
MNPTIAVDFTRIGLICDFLAFFLAAPELLGENGMRKVQKYLRVIMISLSFILFFISLLGAISLLFLWILIPVLMIISTAASLAFPTINTSLSTDNIITIFLLFGLIGALLSWMPSKLMKTVEGLSNDGRFRRQLLNIGVLLFIVGSLAQIIGTF